MVKVLAAQLFSTPLTKAACVLLVLGCAQTSSTLRIEAWDISVDVALTQATREKGLSGRRRFESDGLLFAMPHDEPKALWMRNTFIPLTAIALDDSGCIIAIEELTSLDERIVYLPEHTRWIVELIEPARNDLYTQRNCLDVRSLPLPID